MHEVILTRGDVQGADVNVKARIFVRENCVLVHPGGCHLQAASAGGKRECILHLLEWEGESVFAWLDGMTEWLSYELIGQKRRMIQILSGRER